MPESVSVTTSGNSDDLRALRSRLSADDALRGRVRLTRRMPPVGALGPAIETLTVALGTDGAATALNSALITWIRGQRGDLTLTVARADGVAVEFSAEDVGPDDEDSRSLIADLSADSVRETQTRTGQD
ncbi:effector-associated constant component EACC1 [Nocardia sp. BMG111209]|uniref:effector-associated constant component EACC1 n=1 Tax=Nocardia sp. BMG111209 TaxID=1160137 RepID=UPI0007C4FEC4|nr:hypothetical protein [Nocardia sp. BMG111209]